MIGRAVIERSPAVTRLIERSDFLVRVTLPPGETLKAPTSSCTWLRRRARPCRRRFGAASTSSVGFVTLFGISLRNTIMMIAHYEHPVLVERRARNLSAVIEGAADRLVPILMTSLVTGLGLLPPAIGAGEPGRSIEGPTALVILGGLASSIVLNLAGLPMPALRFARFRSDRETNPQVSQQKGAAGG